MVKESHRESDLGDKRPIKKVEPGKYGSVEILESGEPPAGYHWGELDIKQYLRAGGSEAML